MLLLPSIASANPLKLGEEIEALREWPCIHLDIEDGHFTPNITFGQKTLQAVAALAGPGKLDVHMMVCLPLELLPVIAEAGAPSVCAHIEALSFPLRFLNRARQLGMKAGLALNFSTPLSALEIFLPNLDFALIMTSEPDEAGEKLYPAAFQKALSACEKLPVPIFADGGLGEKEITALHQAGAAGCVLGRSVFGGGDPFENLTHFIELLERT